MSLASRNAVREVETRADMDALLRERVAFVLVYAPWCGHCKRFRPVFAEAAAASAVPYYEVKDEIAKELGNMPFAEVSSFPTVFLMRSGRAADVHHGGDKFEAFIQRAIARTA